jgi:hypothetical protein
MKDLTDALARPDLRAMGMVLVRHGHEETFTVWCTPDSEPAPPAFDDVAIAAGYDPSALLLVCANEVLVYVRPEWEGVRWLTQYVERLAGEIQGRGGLEGFFEGTHEWTLAQAALHRPKRTPLARRREEPQLAPECLSAMSGL